MIYGAGTDMIGGWGWGVPHSKETYSAGYGPYWEMSAMQVRRNLLS